MRVYIVGSGPTAAGFDWGPRGAGDKVIAVNYAALELDTPPDIHLAADWVFWRDHSPRRGSLGVWVDLGDHPGFRPPAGVLRVPSAEPGPEAAGPSWGMSWGDRIEDGLAVGGTSAIAAANLAQLLGATAVHLVGIDLDGEGGKWIRWQETFRAAVGELQARGVAVVYHGAWQG